ncbi:MAG: transketolase [Rikenellaceae bacterium]
MSKFKSLEDLASQVRRDIIRMVADVASGHPGGSLGATDFMVALYSKIMKHNPETFTLEGEGEDVFYLSNGHISPVWYSVLAHNGYFPVSELATFRKLGTRLQGHPSVCYGVKGIRMSSGSLGQGLSCGIGHAMAKKASGDENRVFVLMGDGETQEGQVWEAAMFASANKIDNLIAVIDYNNQQIDGTCDEVLTLGNPSERWAAFGWNVVEMDGHDFEDIIEKMEKASSLLGGGKPVMVIMKTEMGKGVDFMCGTNEYHGKAPNMAQKDAALAQLPETLGDY